MWPVHMRQVWDVMSRDVPTARTDTPYHSIVDLLYTRGVGTVPVLDAAGTVVGVVSETDLLHEIGYSGLIGRIRAPRRWRRNAARGGPGSRTAGDLMSSPPYVITSAAPVVTAADVMNTRRVKRLPVVDDTRLVGMVSRTDLLGVLLKTDEQVRRHVEREVVRPVLWAPDDVRVEVTGGVVRLTGVVERRSLVAVADEMTRAVDGVVDVVNDLGFDIDDSAVGPPPPLSGNGHRALSRSP